MFPCEMLGLRKVKIAFVCGKLLQAITFLSFTYFFSNTFSFLYSGESLGLKGITLHLSSFFIVQVCEWITLVFCKKREALFKGLLLSSMLFVGLMVLSFKALLVFEIMFSLIACYVVCSREPALKNKGALLPLCMISFILISVIDGALKFIDVDAGIVFGDNLLLRDLFSYGPKYYFYIFHIFTMLQFAKVVLFMRLISIRHKMCVTSLEKIACALLALPCLEIVTQPFSKLILEENMLELTSGLKSYLISSVCIILYFQLLRKTRSYYLNVYYSCALGFIFIDLLNNSHFVDNVNYFLWALGFIFSFIFFELDWRCLCKSLGEMGVIFKEKAVALVLIFVLITPASPLFNTVLEVTLFFVEKQTLVTLGVIGLIALFNFKITFGIYKKTLSMD